MTAETDAQASDNRVWFPIGGTYAPVVKATEVPMEDWEADIRQLHELGMTAFRCFIAWDRFEREEGKRDFTPIDRALDLAAKYDIGVMVTIGGVFDNLIGLYPPQWLFKDYPCEETITDPRAIGRPRPSGPRQTVCMDDPIYREKGADFLAELVARIAPHPALQSWVLWNEPNWQGCYCRHTQAKFRTWLQQKYPDLGTLQDAWSTEFPVLFRSWDEVEIPSGVGFRHGGYVPWLDYQTFCQDNMAASMDWIGSFVRKYDSVGHPTTTNLTPGEITNGAYRRHTDAWKIGRILDIQGFSHYTQGNAPDTPPGSIASRLDRLRCTSQAPGREWWIVEAEAGPMYWVHGCTPRHTRIDDRILRYWQAVGHGCKAIFGWMYRSRITDAQAGEFGMLAWDGSPSERAKQTGELGKQLQKHADIIMPRFPKAEVAILAAQNTHNLYSTETNEAQGAARKNYWMKSWDGAYKMLWDARIPADFVNADQLNTDDLSGYKALIIPFCPNMSEAMAKGLRDYVAAGGTVIADFPLGFKSDEGILWRRLPGAGLQEVFGCWANDALPVRDEALTAGDSSFPAHELFLALNPLGDAKVAATYADGTAAAVTNQFGTGQTVLIGTMFFAAHSEGTDAARQHLLQAWLASAGVSPAYSVAASNSPDNAAMIEICELRTLSNDGAPLYVVLNFNDAAVTVDVGLPAAPAEIAAFSELLTGSTMPATRSDDTGTMVRLSLNRKGVALLFPKM